MPEDTDAVISDLRQQLDEVRAELREAREGRTAGIAIGMLLARTPGWTEQDALAAWHAACAELTRDGNIQALASYVIQTGTLPGAGAGIPA